MDYQHFRFKKHTPNAIAAADYHNERHKNPGAFHSNNMIKSEFTKDNFSFIPANNLTLKERIWDVLKENGITKENNNGRKLRKDANLFCEFLIGAGGDFFNGWKNGQPLNEKQNNYFKDAFDFICNLVGKQNVVSAVVHLDESRPHMHVCFVPIVVDKKTGKKKLSARDFNAGDGNNVKTLGKWHTEFNRQVGEKYGLARGGGKSKARYVEKIETYKAKKDAELAVLKAQADFESAQARDDLAAKKAAELADFESQLDARQKAEVERILNERQKWRSQSKISRLKSVFSGESEDRIVLLENALETAQNVSNEKIAELERQNRDLERSLSAVRRERDIAQDDVAREKREKRPLYDALFLAGKVFNLGETTDEIAANLENLAAENSRYRGRGR